LLHTCRRGWPCLLLLRVRTWLLWVPLLLLLLVLSWLLQLLLLLLRVLLVLLLWRRCWPALRVLAAALQQLLHGGGPVHPAASHLDCCMQQAPAEDPQLPGQALVADVAVCCPPWSVPIPCLLHPPQQWVLGVVHCWCCNLQQQLLLSLCRHE
jgi:hypothetical protein